MLKKYSKKIAIALIVILYSIIILYNANITEIVTEGKKILLSAPIFQENGKTILNVDEMRKEPSVPILVDDMEAIYWENGQEKILKDPQTDVQKWYDYYSGRMANAKTKDGSYWVWIPRFAYRITYYTDASKNTVKGYFTDKGFVGPDMESRADESLVKTQFWKMDKEFVPNYEDIKPKGYRIHEAFGKAGTQRKGFWISKYMQGTDGRFTPSNTIQKSQEYAQAFYNIDRMVKENNMYGLDYSLQHTALPRNTEYGALYYLMGLSNPSSTNNTDRTSDPNSNSSSATFGNITGVFDLNNGVREWTADVSSDNIRDLDDQIKSMYMRDYGVDSLYNQKDQNGIEKDRLTLMSKVTTQIPRIVTSGSEKNYGEATFEFMTDYSSTNAELYGGKSIYTSKNNPYNTRTSDIVGNRSVYSFEGVSNNNSRNIGQRAVIYCYTPEGLPVLTPYPLQEEYYADNIFEYMNKMQELENNKKKHDEAVQSKLKNSRGKYIKVTFKSKKRILDLTSKGFTRYGDQEAVFYIAKGTKFPLNLWAGTGSAQNDWDLSSRSTTYRFIGWDINPQGRELYKDTVINEMTDEARISLVRVVYEPYKDKKKNYGANVRIIDENIGFMYDAGRLPIGTSIKRAVSNLKPRLSGYSLQEEAIIDGEKKKVEEYFMPTIETSRVFNNDLVLTSLLLKDEWLKYKEVKYYIENPNKQYIGTESVVQGNKPQGPQNIQVPQGKRIIGFSPSLDFTVTDNIEIKVLFEDAPVPPENATALTVDLNGGGSNLMQNGERIYVVKNKSLRDPENQNALNRIRSTVVTKLGNTFKGWSIREDMPITTDMNLTALWEPIQVSYTYRATEADSNYIVTGKVNAGSVPPPPENTPKRKGYEFYGWSPESHLPIYSNTEYNAIWVKKDDPNQNQNHPSNGNDQNNGGNNNGRRK